MRLEPPAEVCRDYPGLRNGMWPEYRPFGSPWTVLWFFGANTEQGRRARAFLEGQNLAAPMVPLAVIAARKDEP